jgi:prepilin peptidase CpaA
MRHFLLAAIVISAVAAVIDWKRGEIPNLLTLLPLAISPLAYGAFALRSFGWNGALFWFGFSAVGAVACGLAPMLMWLMNGGGGGDVKLLAALGAMLGPLLGLEAEFYAFFVAALFALAKLTYDGKLLKTLGNTLSLVTNVFKPKDKRRALSEEMMTKLRFGPAAFVGLCLAAFVERGFA